MAAIDFPASPSNGQTLTVGNTVYTYNSTKGRWEITSAGLKGQKGTAGSNGAKGQKGQKGTAGSNGAKGQKGQKGQTGAKGQKGQTGAGTKGQKGETGSQGPAGSTGVAIAMAMVFG